VALAGFAGGVPSLGVPTVVPSVTTVRSTLSMVMTVHFCVAAPEFE
jgi:hypothetical protein